MRHTLIGFRRHNSSSSVVSDMLRIAAIVEGDGEVPAVPILLRRFGEHLGRPGQIEVIKPFRVPASKLLKDGELERTVELAARKVGNNGGIFILLDCEDNCPACLGPELLRRAHSQRPNLPIGLVLAYREYEAWFLGSAASLAGRRMLPTNITNHPSPETPRDCKGWLSAQMPRGHAYSETEDQPALTQLFDLDSARTACASFDKCFREVQTLFERIDPSRPLQPVEF